ncbi:glycosyltransferase [Tamlana agarivorans]|uniref:Glycosyltransferase n=1 Tax=Pseudotamlana agarivorans TaxID=481183 RepID=A0ACC5U7R0_9FLAO|nr:glycosyltransferase family 2 protein [Tamlana agarivorans]MBU2950245.1 glycosyltransferase [Tamlana agarivorans]
MKNFISIIIPSYNKAPFIAETLESLINQTYPNWEAVIVDDGSTDNSIDIINAFCNQDSRIKLYERVKLPKGGSTCRNIGLKQAKGKYILFLDADDLLAQECLNQRLSLISQSPNNNFWVFSTGTFYKKIGDSNSIWVPKGDNFLIRFLKHNLPWNIMSVVWDRTYINQLNGFDTDFTRLQDVELHTRALLDKSVSFETYPTHLADAFYRIDTERTGQDIKQQLEKQKNGVLTYLKKTTPLLKTNKQKRAINGTIFEFITALNYNCLVLNNEVSLHVEIYKEIIQFIKEHPSNLFKLKYINFYVYLYKKGFWKIKGFNYTMKYLLCL